MRAAGERRRRLPPPLHPRHRLDVDLPDLLFALLACLTARRAGREDRVLAAWPDQANRLVCLSVRSGFDLLLSALDLEPGDEIVVSPVTHPDMTRIAVAHGLRVLPVDLDLETLAPRIDALERALGPRTRVILVAHLFGSRCDMAPIAELARRHGILVVEDCAQAFCGPGQSAESHAGVSLFSFGSIKTATALGGCLLMVDDAALRDRMSELGERWPVQARLAYARRVVTVLGLHLLRRPRVYGLLASSLAFAGFDLGTVVGAAVRGFAGDDLTARLRRRPSAPLLALLERRLAHFDSRRLDSRILLGERVAEALPPALERPGRAAPVHAHWVFPVMSASPGALVASLRTAGFDASARTSGIAVVGAPSDRPDLEPENARRLLERVVFVPAYPELEPDIERLLAALR